MAPDQNAPTGNVAADLAEDAKEVGEGVITFIQAEIDLVKAGITAEKNLISGAVTNATAWLAAKSNQLSADAQTGLASIIQEAASTTKDPASLVSSVLDVIYNDAKMAALGVTSAAKTELQGVESSVLAGVAGVTTLLKTL